MTSLHPVHCRLPRVLRYVTLVYLAGMTASNGAALRLQSLITLITIKTSDSIRIMYRAWSM